MRTIVRRVLRQAGFGQHHVLEAQDGFDAIETIKGERPHLILADWNMPKMNGLDLLKTLRKAKMSMPFGFVTAEGTADMRKLAHDAGAQFVVAKPFNSKTFRTALSCYLG
jgi:two-component system chemotaxis response regulator CheY